MANRRMNQFRYSMEFNVVDLYAVVTIGATGAPTLTIGGGITSISRTSAGLYVLTLTDIYNKLLDVTMQSISGSSAQAAPCMTVVSETVASTKLVTVQCRAIDNSTATDPANGEILLIKLTMRNSSLAPSA